MKEVIIVTGGAGFIGSNVVEALNKLGHNNIIIVDRLGSGLKWKNLIGLKYQHFFHKDTFRQLINENKLPYKVSAIIHMGACSSTTERNADYLLDNNYHYTKELSIFALKNNIRFIYASSAATYGMGLDGYSDDESSINILKPLNMYGYSKQMFDEWALQEGILSKIVGLKFFNVYGPKERHKEGMSSMVIKAFDQVNSTGCIRLFKSVNPKYKDGEQLRDFVYVDDCSKIILWLLQKPSINGIINVGSGIARTWNDLASAVFKAMNKPEKIEYFDMPQNLLGQYQDYTKADMNKIKKLGYQNELTSLEDGVLRYVINES